MTIATIIRDYLIATHQPQEESHNIISKIERKGGSIQDASNLGLQQLNGYYGGYWTVQGTIKCERGMYHLTIKEAAGCQVKEYNKVTMKEA